MSHLVSPTLSHPEATAILEQAAVKSAHLVDAILVGINAFNARMGIPHHNGPALHALFSRIGPHRVHFALFIGESRVGLCAYSYNPDTMLQPRLSETDTSGVDVGPTDFLQRLQPLFDEGLAAMESQVWRRVNADV